MYTIVDKIRENAVNCRNMLDLCNKIGIKNIGGNTYREIKRIAAENNIDLKFTFKKQWNNKNNFKGKKFDEILIEHSPIKNNNHLKEKLLKSGLKERRCENPECGLTEWHGKQIPLQLHHINGIRDDNRLENLQILCPNCHALTDNFGGKNANRSEYQRKKEINNKLVRCPIERDLLEILIYEKSFAEIGRMYNVSDTAIRKWCKKYNLPYRKKDIK